MENVQVIEPTITERGATYSRGVLDHAGSALTQVKAQFCLPLGDDVVPGLILERLRFFRSHLFALLDDAHARLILHREQLRELSRQLANGTERYDDLPSPSCPFKFLGPTQDVDFIRQKILDERARLLEEERRLHERFWADINELKGKTAEVLAEYVGLASRVEALTGQRVPVPALTECFAFLDALEPEEVLVVHPPQDVSHDALLVGRMP